jgi:multidrug efflux pump subunit AcrB
MNNGHSSLRAEVSVHLLRPRGTDVLAALILFLGGTAITVMPIDIFPEIDIPVVSAIWQYTGLSTSEMEQRVSTYSQYSISSNVNGIKDMEARRSMASQSRRSISSQT